MNKISRKGTAHAVISETSGAIFSSSFKVGTMIEMELENSDRSVILNPKRLALNSLSASLRAQRSIIEIGDGELPGRSSRQKLPANKRSGFAETTATGSHS